MVQKKENLMLDQQILKSINDADIFAIDISDKSSE